MKGLKLVDSGHRGDIDISIGFDYYWNLVTGKVNVRLIEETMGVETQFGWALNGQVVCLNGESYRVHFASCTSAHIILKIYYSNIDTEDNFWNLETIY